VIITHIISFSVSTFYQRTAHVHIINGSTTTQ